MYGSPSTPVSKDHNLPYPSAVPLGGGHLKEESTSGTGMLSGHHQGEQLSAAGLLRYRSAPSSLLGELCEDFLPVRTSFPETDTLIARFLAPDLQIRHKPPGGAGGRAATGRSRPQFASPQLPPAEGSGAFSSASNLVFHSQQKQQQMQNDSSVYPAAMDSELIKNGGLGSSFARHSSSPAGLFTHLNAENGYPMLRRVAACFSNENGAMGHETGRLKNQISFSSRQNSIMSQISEAINGGSSSPEECSRGRCHIPGFPPTSWDNSSLFSGNNNNFSGKITDGLNPSELENGEVGNHVSGLNHQLSLPKTSSEMTAMGKYLQFQVAVPCKIRAKRGCATHPRSIAERVRRTRISERIRKLQELVPYMDKQTNTADMLDLAVSYIKDLQKQVKTLSANRASCSCSSGEQKQYLNPSG